MTEDPQDQEYLDLFKPKAKADQPAEDVSGNVGSDTEALGPSEAADAEPGLTDAEPWEAATIPTETLTEVGGGIDSNTIKSVGAVVGAGCLLLMLLAVVVFAFFQVFVRRGGDDEDKGTPTPTVLVAATPTTAAAVVTPVFVPLVSSTDVRVPVALPERLIIGESVFGVQAVKTPTGSWPPTPATVDTANWAYGTVVNYILSLAPVSRNLDLISGLQRDDTLSLYMSTGVILNFSVRMVTVGASEDPTVFEQTSPRLTLSVQTDDPAQGVVVTAIYRDDEAQDAELFSSAIIGLVGTPVEQGPVRVTVMDVYQVSAAEAGLPTGTGYLLIDLTVENVGTVALEPQLFLTFMADASGKRYPLAVIAEQYTHHGIPMDPLGPGETVIGSVGYLVPGNPDGEVRWFFNPQPGSNHWVVVPLSYDLPPPPVTMEPTPAAGFAVVTISTSDIFINRDDGLLDIVLRIENPSAGVVTVTKDDVGLSTWTDGEIALVAPAPQLPWTVDPGELKLFQLQFRLPTTETALLTVLGYTFSIENLGGE